MNIQIEERDSGSVLVLKGALSIYQAAALREAFMGVLRDQSEIALDLEHVTEMDTSALQLLVALLQTAAGHGKLARIVSVGRVVGEVIRFCNLQDELGLKLP